MRGKWRRREQREDGGMIEKELRGKMGKDGEMAGSWQREQREDGGMIEEEVRGEMAKDGEMREMKEKTGKM